jgi:hypothetical protein
MSQEADRALLERFEPVVRYTRGERFFPMDVDAYVRESSLWVQRPGEEAECLVPEGRLSLDRLGEPRAGGMDAVYFLKFIEPMNVAELASYRIQQVREQLIEGQAQARFRAGRGRLARVGYVSRLIDAIFSITLLARGRVSGDTAVAAALTYQRMIGERERYSYYGRVVRQGGWTVLQYWFFYAFNCWRSSFFGVNDHEADWEMICVYLGEDPHTGPRPEWVAYASHDYHGDDLRRRWDDPELEKVGDHPVVYAGAGSHASYFVQGEYLAELEIPFLAPIDAAVNQVRRIWDRLTRRSSDRSEDSGAEIETLRVPFVDYARGDGLSVGPGQDMSWEEPGMLDPIPGWVLHYRGLWGLYARDPISGENAPAGPMYNRDGSVRRAWYDPVGWAGLDKVPPSDVALSRLRQRRAEVASQRNKLRETIAQKSETLLARGVEVEALQSQPHLEGLYAQTQAEVQALSEEIDQMRAQVAASGALLEALDEHAARIEAGERAPVRAHLARPHDPATDEELRLGCLAEAWAAISVGLMMVSLVALILFAQQYLVVGLAALVALVVFIEAGFRRRLRRFIGSVTIALAVAAALILAYEFFWLIVVLVVLFAGSYLVVENLRELWR